jgi:hypothetical protein
MTTPTWDTLSIDTRHALRTATSRLADEFAGIYVRETIERSFTPPTTGSRPTPE